MPMHDFCILPVHAGLLALGGIIAYNHKKSEVLINRGWAVSCVFGSDLLLSKPLCRTCDL